jgi:hypothetical protein
MKEIGAEIKVNESRVSQLHARAIQRLRKLLCADAPAGVGDSRAAVVAFSHMLERMKAARSSLAILPARHVTPAPVTKGVLLPYAKPHRPPRLSRAHPAGAAFRKSHLRPVAMAR